MITTSVLSEAVNNLWFWTYSMVAGWGLTFTLVVASLVVLAIKHIRLYRRTIQIENRLVALERDFNLTFKSWPGKK